jgi:putative Mg2+ transporter-C (MgtC) family protein
MLVCMGATLSMIVSQYGFENVLHQDLVILDPSRVAAQVVSGIGFLGAGTIIFWKSKIRGLTTAASLWTVAAVGLSIGGALYIAAIFATFFVLIILAVIKPLERILTKKRAVKEIKFSIRPAISLLALEEILKTLNLRPYLTDIQIESDETKENIHLIFKDDLPFDLFKIAEEIKKISGFEKIEVIE